jgi:hypothetical protein
MMGGCGADDVVVECVFLRQLVRKLRFQMAVDSRRPEAHQHGLRLPTLNQEHAHSE